MIMINTMHIAGAFSFPNGDKCKDQLLDIVKHFIDFGYSVTIEPKETSIQIDIYEGEKFQNRPLPFGEEE